MVRSDINCGYVFVLGQVKVGVNEKKKREKNPFGNGVTNKKQIEKKSHTQDHANTRAVKIIYLT